MHDFDTAVNQAHANTCGGRQNQVGRSPMSTKGENPRLPIDQDLIKRAVERVRRESTAWQVG